MATKKVSTTTTMRKFHVFWKDHAETYLSTKTESFVRGVKDSISWSGYREDNPDYIEGFERGKKDMKAYFENNNDD